MLKVAQNFRYVVNKYKHELKLLFISLFFTTIITIVITAWFQSSDARIIVNVTIGAVLFILLLAILFNLRSFLITFLTNSRLQLSEEVYQLFQRSQYRDKQREFTVEKEVLASVLVEKTLPKIIKRICSENPFLTKLNIILDSGTTITPIFRNLIALGVPHDQEGLRITIYTNNIAGIAELQKVDARVCKLKETDFVLIGGTPLSKYNATVGEATENFLKTIWEEQNQLNGKIVTLTIMTASWFIGGTDLKNIKVCARGDFHFQNKHDLITNSRYVILVTPVARITQLSSSEQLNSYLPDVGKNQYSILPADLREKSIHLLTSFRSSSSLSPFVNLSVRMSTLMTRNETQNYVFCEDCPIYDPDGDKWQVIVTDLPFEYIRDNFSEVYGYQFF